jgi:protein O-mannosyl-transferase
MDDARSVSSPIRKEFPERWGGLIGCLVLTFGVLACYWPARHFNFVNLDDPLYVYQNHMVQQGLSWPGVIWAFHSVKGGNWNPLVWLSHMADCQLYGVAPGGHHVTNLLLHAANALLLFLLLKRMTGALWRSGLAAAIFAWHPLHVESVAWVSERKDVLSTLFFLLTLWAYGKYAEVQSVESGTRTQTPEGNVTHHAPRTTFHASRFSFHPCQQLPSALYYVLALVLFALGLMCKPMLVSLPFILVLLDYWPLRRWGVQSLRAKVPSPRRLLLEKLPFAVLSLAASLLTVWAQQSEQALGAARLSLRLENAAVSYATYLEMLFWPIKLAVFYPFPHSISMWRVGAAALMLGAISWAVVRGMKERPYLGVGWLWFLGTLVPVIGLLQVGMQAMADRYTYVPYIGLALMVSWGLADLAGDWPRGRAALASIAALALGCCLATTRSQVKYWRDSTALYERALKVTSGNFIAHGNLGDVLVDEGRLDEAVKHYQEALRLTPAIGKPYNDLGKAYALQGKLDDAMTLFSNAVRLNPGLAQAHWNLGNAWLLKGKVAEGLAEMKRAVQLDPEDIKKHRMLAETLLKTGREAEALPYCEVVVKEEPEDAHGHFLLGSACLADKRLDRAMASFKQAVRLAPNAPECINALAWIYATSPRAELRNGAEAVRLAEQACQITQRQKTAILDTLAAAYAEAGRFQEAVQTTEELRALALSSHDAVAADTARQRLELYQSGKAYRDE